VDEELEEFLSAANVWLIPHRKDVAGVSVPSRLYNLLAVGRPVILVSEPDAEAARTVAKHDVGRVPPPGDAGELARTIGLAFSSEDPLRAERAAAIARAIQFCRGYGRLFPFDSGAAAKSRMRRLYAGRGFENRYIVSATPMPPMIVTMTSIVADCVLAEAIASTARPTLSANTSLTTRSTVKPLSVARW